MHQTSMHPDSRERRFACKVFGLRNLAGMVWEREISATTMDVYLLAEVTHRHRAALDMPAGASWTPGTRPCRFTGSLRLPEDKVKRVLLASIIREIPTLIGDGQHGLIIIQTNGASQNTKLRVLPNAVIDITLTLVCISTGNKSLNNLNHRWGFLAGIRINIRSAHV